MSELALVSEVVLAVVSYLGHSKKILIDWLIDPRYATCRRTATETIIQHPFRT